MSDVILDDSFPLPSLIGAGSVRDERVKALIAGQVDLICKTNEPRTSRDEVLLACLEQMMRLMGSES